jgi:hypothetical protein
MWLSDLNIMAQPRGKASTSGEVSGAGTPAMREETFQPFNQSSMTLGS